MSVRGVRLERGERILGVDPPFAPVVETWRRRMNLYPGRALDENALTAEQAVRGGRLAARGQVVSPGVVSGLDVRLEPDPGGPMLRINAGQGLAATGEDVILLTEIRVAIADTLVVAPIVNPPVEPEDPSAPARPLSQLAPRVPVGPFRTWSQSADPALLPHAAILVLIPADIDLFQARPGAPDPADDPCEEDPSAYAFENWERRDGCRVALFAWPEDWRPLPERILPSGPDPRWRNRIAYTVFREELKRGPGDLLPWEIFTYTDGETPRDVAAVPLALIGFDEAWAPLFADQATVARAGGKPRRRTALLPGRGSPFLWQARFDQLVEHLASLDPSQTPIETIRAQFRYLPPSGLLPKSAMQVEFAEQFLFPSSYVIDAAPVPTEHLDVALEASASLAPYDLDTPDQVRFLVPVPQSVYEPRLLYGEDVDPRFPAALNDALDRRADWLERRETVRRRAEVLLGDLTGLRPSYPPPELDPNRLETDEPSPVTAVTASGDPVATAQEVVPITGRAHQSGLAAGLHEHAFTGADPALALAPGDRLVVWVFLDPSAPSQQLRLRLELVTAAAPTTADVVYLTWGANLIASAPVGATVVAAGPLPLPGRWARLVVPAADAGIEGRAIHGITFSAWDGRVSWARLGKSALGSPAPADEVVWVDRDLPPGSHDPMAGVTPAPAGAEPWIWIEAMNPSPPAEDDYQTSEAGTPPIRVADSIARLFADLQTRPMSDASRERLYRLGLGPFIDVLTAEIDRTNDQVNFGYLRIQAAMYRLRQAVLGDKVADQLVTNPVVAEIAKESVTKLQVDKSLTEILTTMRQTKAEPRWWSRELELSGPAGGGGEVDGPVKGSSRQTSKAVFGGAAGAKEILLPKSESHAMLALEAAKLPGIALIPGALPTGRPGAGGGEAGGGGARGSTADGGKADATQEVEAARPVLDKPIRTTSIAERLFDSKAVEAKDFCAATKRDIIRSLLDLPIFVDDLPVPGLQLFQVDGPPDAEGHPTRIPPDDQITFENPPPASGSFPFRGISTTDGVALMQPGGLPAREATPRTLAEFRGDRGPALLRRIAGDMDPLAPMDTESALFAVGSDLLSHATAALRGVEARVADYRAIVARCNQALGELTEAAGACDERLKVVEDQLSEARHDVATTRALLVEEQARVDQVNRRREQVLREHVKFLAYHRPRLTDPLLDAPTRPLDPGPTPSAVPGCLTQTAPLPPELQDYLDLLRHAPVGWFHQVPDLLDRFDRIESLQALLGLSRVKDQLGVNLLRTVQAPVSGGTLLGQALSGLREAHENILAAGIQQRRAADPASLAEGGWKTLRLAAPVLLGLGDLLDPGHGHVEVAGIATTTFQQISRVAGCLYRHFGSATPALRMQWAVAFSEFDQPVSLRRLSVLPSWGELDVLERRHLQEMVDWLFQRIRDDVAEAVSYFNDLVRTCLLLASHSPVDQILAGQVRVDTPVHPGGRVPITLPTLPVRIGMKATFYRGAEIVARGVVDDLAPGVASATLVGPVKVTALASGARVQFST